MKCKGCNRNLKPDELEYKIGDAVIVNGKDTPLINSGVIEPFCKKCIIELLGD